MSVIWITAAMLLFEVLSVESLRNYKHFAEGSCAGHYPQPVERLDTRAYLKMIYLVAGSKYHLFRDISPLPNYAEITEDSFLKCSCLQVNSTDNGNAYWVTLNAFGKPLTTYEAVAKVVENEALTIDAKPMNNFPSLEVLKVTPVYTDNQNFVFLHDCWEDANERGEVAWSVLSRTRTLSELDKQIILLILENLGFQLENALFLEGQYCDQCLHYSKYPEYEEYYK